MKLETYLDELKLLVDRDSGTQNCAGVTEMAKIMQQKYVALGWHTQLADLGTEVGNGLFVTNKAKAEQYDVLLVGHLDTVFPDGTAAERAMSWDDTRAYGPGVADMKSGILNILWALRALDPKDSERLAIAVAMNPDEETGSSCSHHWIGNVAKKSRCVLVVEGARADGSLVKARKGVANYVLSFAGVASHAGNAPEQGRSAIVELAHWILATKAWENPEKGTTLNVGVIKGGDATNVVADKAEAWLDLRFKSNSEYDRIQDELNKIQQNSFTADIQVTVTQRSLSPAMEPSQQTQLLMKKVEQCGKLEGIDVQWQSVGGGSDANHTAALGIPSLDGFGAIGGFYHSPKEYIELESILPRIRLLSRVVASL